VASAYDEALVDIFAGIPAALLALRIAHDERSSHSNINSTSRGKKRSVSTLHGSSPFDEASKRSRNSDPLENNDNPIGENGDTSTTAAEADASPPSLSLMDYDSSQAVRRLIAALKASAEKNEEFFIVLKIEPSIDENGMLISSGRSILVLEAIELNGFDSDINDCNTYIHANNASHCTQYS
jgi:hypothetical protein